MTVSVGSAGSERQITNVANATQGTDAVNKRQLDAALAGVGGGADPLSVKYDSSAKNSVMLGGGAAGTKIDNVAAGELSATSKEAVNGGQLFATNQRVSTAEGHITNIQGDIGTINTSIGSIQGDVTNVGNRVTNVEGDITTIQGTLGNAVMYDSAAKTSITLGDGTSAVTLKNVADGVAAKDAVNKGQLDRLRDALGEADGLAVKYDSAAQNAITLGGAAGTKIANVAAGELSATSKDAVNGGQLFATNQNVDHLGTRVTNVEGDLTSLHTNINNGTVGLVRQDADTLAISVAADKGGSSVNFAGADGDRRLAGVADGVAQNDAVNVKQLKGAGLIGDGGNLMDAVVYDAGSNKAQITLGGLGANAAPVILTNVADGKSQYDAVNFGQLERLQGHVNSIDNRVTNLENSGGSGGGSNGNGNDGQSPVIVDGRNPFFEATVPKSDQASAKASVGQGRGNTAGGANAKVEGNFGTALGANSSAIADKAVAVGSGAVASGAGSMALGSDAQASGANSVALGQGSVASRANSVSVGSAGNERQVTNVAAGTAMTDAVNVQQLQDAQASSAAYTDARLDQVQSTVQGVKRDASAAAAGAMAAANLPQSINPGKAMMSAAMANVGGESAVAIGVSKVADNGRWITKFSGTANTRGQVGVGAGIGFQW